MKAAALGPVNFLSFQRRDGGRLDRSNRMQVYGLESDEGRAALICYFS